ncbi:MAG: DUF58 domain-containing protein, partial [Pseudomonadales bacterium]|nr:DUF58 domain-containing protein [Pseudomonadales bacterium]
MGIFKTKKPNNYADNLASNFATDNFVKSSVEGRVYSSLEDLIRLRFTAAALQLPSAKRGLRQQSGPNQSRFRGRGMEFAEVRAYQPGDDIRSIDWRVTARRQKPHTKLYHEERERPVTLLCDQSLSQFFGSRHCFKSVLAAEIAATLSWLTINKGDRVGGLVFSDHEHREIRPARSRKTLMHILNTISEFNQKLNVSDTESEQLIDLNSMLQEYRRIGKPGGLLIIISDFLDFNPESRKILFELQKHSEIIAIQTSDPLDFELPPPGMYPISDGKQFTLLDTYDNQARSRYKS